MSWCLSSSIRTFSFKLYLKEKRMNVLAWLLSLTSMFVKFFHVVVVAVVYSFSLQFNISLYEYNTVSLSYCLLWTFGLFPILGYITSSAAIHIGSCKEGILSIFCWVHIYRHKYIYLEVDLLNHRKCVCSIVSITEWFSKMVVQFILSPLVWERVPIASHPYQHLVLLVI